MEPNPQYIILFHHFRRVLVAAAKDGIDVAPLKGAHLLTNVYPDGEGRGVISDVDFLVRPADWERTIELLTELDFVAVERAGRHEIAFVYYLGDGRHVMFEAHRSLFEPRRFPIDHDALWERSYRAAFEGAPCRRLSDEDHFCHIAFHSAIHRLMNLNVNYRDLQLILENGDAGLVDRIIERATQWKTTRSVWLFLNMLGKNDDVDDSLAKAAQSIAPCRPVRRVLAFLVPNVTATRVAFLNHRVQAAVLWPLLFDSPLRLARMLANHPLIKSPRSSN